MPAAMKRQLGWTALSVLTLWACSDARLVDGFSGGQTRIRVLPEAFIGDVPCVRGAPGSLQSYVVRLQPLIETGDAGSDAPVELTTSPPVPCDRAVSFSVIPTRFYVADILGFDRDIEASEVDSATPRWTATCGRGDPSGSDAGAEQYAPTWARSGVIVPLRGCTHFGGPVTTPSQLVVDLASALGELRCGREPGEVAIVEGVLEGSRRAVSCGDPLIFPIAAPGGFHSIELTGFELPADAGGPPDAGLANGIPDAAPPDSGVTDAAADAADSSTSSASILDASAAEAGDAGGGPTVVVPSGPPRWRTTCLGRSVTGVTRVATCEPFAPVAP
jgi:hypothetical protein